MYISESREVTEERRSDCCKRCGFPVCPGVCSKEHRGAVECKVGQPPESLSPTSSQVFRQSGFRPKVRKLGEFNSQFSAITVLRLLAWLDTERQYRDIVLNMEDHDQERREHQPHTWNIQKHLIIEFLQNVGEN